MQRLFDAIQRRCPVRRFANMKIEPLVFLHSLSYGITMSNLPQYVFWRMANYHGAPKRHVGRTTHTGCGIPKPQNNKTETTPDDEFYRQLFHLVQKEATNWTTYLGLCESIPTFVMVLLLAWLSAHIGGKVMLMLSTGALAAANIVTYIVIATDWPLWTVGLGPLIIGASGGMMSMSAFTSAYLSATTAESEKRTRFTILGYMYSIPIGGFGVVTGWMIKLLRFSATQLIACIISVIAFVYVAFLVPTLPRQTVIMAHLKSNPMYRSSRNTSADRGWRELLKDIHRPVWYVVLPLVIHVISNIARSGTGAISMIFEMGYPYCWDAVFIGYFGVVDLVAGTLGVGVMFYCLQNRVPQVMYIIIGLSSTTAAMLFFAFSADSVTLFGSVIAGAFSGTSSPALSTILLKHLPADLHTAMFSILAFIDSLTAMAAPPVMNIIYTATVHWMRGFVFLLAGIMTTVAIIISLTIYICTRGDDFEEESSIVTYDAETIKLATQTNDSYNSIA